MSQDTLEVVAGKINALQDKIGKADKDRRQYIDTRNSLIIEAHKRIVVEKELDTTFETWIADNTDLHRSTVTKIVAKLAPPEPQEPSGITLSQKEPVLYPRNLPAGSDVDPFSQFWGAVSTDVLPKPADPLDPIKRAIQQLTGGQFDELRDWMDEEAERLGR